MRVVELATKAYTFDSLHCKLIHVCILKQTITNNPYQYMLPNKSSSQVPTFGTLREVNTFSNAHITFLELYLLIHLH